MCGEPERKFIRGDVKSLITNHGGCLNLYRYLIKCNPGVDNVPVVKLVLPKTDKVPLPGEQMEQIEYMISMPDLKIGCFKELIEYQFTEQEIIAMRDIIESREAVERFPDPNKHYVLREKLISLIKLLKQQS